MSIKKQMIEALKYSIEKKEADIIKYSQPCEKSLAQNRTAHREWLKKKAKELKSQLKELEDERKTVD